MIELAKLYFKYGAMNSGKTIEVLRTCYNYQERGLKVALIKPSVDKKGSKNVVSRIGISKEVDYLILNNDDLLELFKNKKLDVIIADEAQFFTKEQIDELWYITKTLNVVVLCYGLRCDFLMNGFPGATRLLEIADSIDEIKTICKCGKKATNNLRMINGIPTFEGDQVSIDGFDNVTYDALCGHCYIELKRKMERKK